MSKIVKDFILGIDPFCYTVAGDDMCAWCRRNRPIGLEKWEDGRLEEHHDSDCEYIAVMKEVLSAN